MEAGYRALIESYEEEKAVLERRCTVVVKEYHDVIKAADYEAQAGRDKQRLVEVIKEIERLAAKDEEWRKSRL